MRSFDSHDPPAISAVVVAAGSGSRVGADRNKVLLPLAGEPILAHTLRHLLAIDELDEVVVVCREGDEAAMRSIAEALRPPIPVRFARGGKERSDSVRNGVFAAAATELVLVHDAARPFLGRALARALIAAAREHGAAIPGLPVVDTVKRVDADSRGPNVASTIDRKDLVAAQTPQAFRIGEFKDALDELEATTLVTDDASIYERLHRRVSVVAGDPLNVKVTTPMDLALAPRHLEIFREREAAQRQEDRR